MSQKIIVNFIVPLGHRAGVIDGTIEGGGGSIDCQKDRWDVSISSATAGSNFLSQIGVSSFGGWGAVTTTIAGAVVEF